jgi:methionyl-tRNA formyltransferase
MRIAFAGTPEFARVALSALLAAGHDIPLVLTQPDRPAGRGLKLTPSPVKQAALDAGITVQQPRSLRLDGKYPEEAAAAQDALRAAGIQLMVVAAYGLILPLSALTLPPLGCLNIHASLLPRWRGAAPIQRAIEAGDAETGITIMQMDEGLDTGAMLSRVAVPIGPMQTAAELHDVLAHAGGELIVQTLAHAEAGTLAATPQPEQGVTYAAKLDKAEALLDWQAPAGLLARRVRAFNPVPGASARLAGIDDPVKIWRASASAATAASAAATPGTVLRADAHGIDIATADGVLRLLELQKAGGKRQPVDVFVRGWGPPATC